VIVRRTRLVGAQAELWPDWRYFPFLTNRTETLEIVEAEHRRHAVVELTIRDLKDQALAHFPSGQFNANSAWILIACLAYNLLRWTSVVGLPGHTVRTARTLRRRLLQIPGRLTRTARQWTLHLPARRPWATRLHPRPRPHQGAAAGRLTQTAPTITNTTRRHTARSTLPGNNQKRFRGSVSAPANHRPTPNRRRQPLSTAPAASHKPVMRWIQALSATLRSPRSRAGTSHQKPRLERRLGLNRLTRAPQHGLEQSGKPALEVVAAQRVDALGADHLLVDQAGFAKHLEVMGAGGLHDG
jgi:Transposase DDE domain group 1